MAGKIEERALKIAKKLIKKKYGKFPSKANVGAGCDLTLDKRHFEVKGRRSSRPPSIPLTKKELETILRQDKSYIYLIYNLKERKPKWKIFNKEKIIKYLLPNLSVKLSYRLGIPRKLFRK